MATTRYLCPLSGCDWHHDEARNDGLPPMLTMPDAEMVAACDGDLLEAIVYATADAERLRIDAILREHLAMHRVEDYLLEIVKLRGDSYKAALAVDSVIQGYLEPGRVPLARKLLEGLRADLTAMGQPKAGG